MQWKISDTGASFTAAFKDYDMFARPVRYGTKIETTFRLLESSNSDLKTRQHQSLTSVEKGAKN